MAEGFTLSGLPVPTAVPPQLPENQSTTSPELTRTESDVEPPEQIVAGLATGLVGVAGLADTFTVTFAHRLSPQPGLDHQQ